MNIKLLYEIWSQLKDFFSSDKVSPLWRFILCFFSTDYFIRFKFEWIEELENISSIDLRTIEIFYFIGIFIFIWFVMYGLLAIPLRLLFHGKVKKKALALRKQLSKSSKWEQKRGTIEFVAFISPFFHKYLFNYGVISSNDLNEPLAFDFESKEKEFNEGMKMLYRWILTVIHTLLVSIIVWKFYSVWFFVIVLIVLALSVILALIFTFLALNLDYLESVRLQLLKENKKHWK